MRIEYHRTLLADRVRNEAFHAALKHVIKPGKSLVADIGTGTGFLGFLANKLGAARVDMYDEGDISEVARRLLKHNQLKGCRIATVHSTAVAEPDKVDIVVSETLGNYPFEENIIGTLNDARERYLKPGGVIIPGGVEQFVCPVTAERLYKELTIWDDVGFGLDFAPARAMSFNNIYVRWLEPADLLDAAKAARKWDEIDFSKRNKTTRSGEVSWSIEASTTIFGLALWWRAELVKDLWLGTGPLDPRTHWEQLYLPVLKPMTLAAGDRLSVRLRSTTSFENGTNVTWTLTQSDAKGREKQRQSMDLEKGYIA
jgi:protein arginine N-methyltransferase 1